MDITPLWESEWLVIVHALAAILAFVIGTIQLVRVKGTNSHRHIGRVWVVIMVVVALSSFGIHHFKMFGPFSLIHLLSLLTLYTLWESIRAIRKGNVERHRKSMLLLYFLALLLTGVFTFAPGRVMYRVFFG